MDLRDKIIIDLYFPQFESPLSSRFESLFLFLNKNDSNAKKKNIISYTILPDQVMQGEDKRTSLIIKNIPKNIKKKEIRSLIEKYGNINFLAVSKDKNVENCIVAYLNVINYKSIVPIFMGLRKLSFSYLGKTFNIEINYSKVQGKDELKKLFNYNYEWNK
jgi:RNA recognition motif-containing protein